jgi:hypothetical protein
MSETANQLPGQQPLFEDMGYEAITLKPQVERFCQKFVLQGCCNAKRAYMAVYPSTTERSAETSSSRLLINDEVKQRVKQIQAEWRRRLEAKVLSYHDNVLSVNRRGLLDENGICKPLDQWGEDEISILEFEQVSAKNGVRTLLKIPTRHQSAVELARISGMHKDKVEMTGANGGPIETTTRPQLSREEWLALHGLPGGADVDPASRTATGSD